MIKIGQILILEMLIDDSEFTLITFYNTNIEVEELNLYTDLNDLLSYFDLSANKHFYYIFLSYYFHSNKTLVSNEKYKIKIKQHMIKIKEHFSVKNQFRYQMKWEILKLEILIFKNKFYKKQAWSLKKEICELENKPKKSQDRN